MEGPEELQRHLFFHCYHTKLKQLGKQALAAHPEIGSCSIGYNNLNIIPEIPGNFVCLWRGCEVSLVESLSINCIPIQVTFELIVTLHNVYCFVLFLKQAPFKNPEWFFRHVEMHGLLVDVPPGDRDSAVRCEWKGGPFIMIYILELVNNF